MIKSSAVSGRGKGDILTPQCRRLLLIRGLPPLVWPAHQRVVPLHQLAGLRVAHHRRLVVVVPLRRRAVVGPLRPLRVVGQPALYWGGRALVIFIAHATCGPPWPPGQHLYSLQLCRLADNLTAIAGSIVVAIGQEGYGVADTLLVDGRNRERVQSPEAMIGRVGWLRRDCEFNSFEGEERGSENDRFVDLFP